MIVRRLLCRLSVVLLLLISAAVPFAAESPAVVLPPSLRDFTARLETARAQLPLILQAAEAAAARKVEHPDALLNITYSLQSSFAEELLNRSGGLAEALPSEERPGQVTDNDFVVFSIRSWDTDGEKGLAYLRDCRKKGWMITLFASSAGKPSDLDVDWFIDNGAKTGTDADAAVNSAANALNGWLWVCEYTAALTRLGKYPGILQSITTAGSIPFDGKLQDGRVRHLNIFPGDTALPAGDLSRIYLARVDRMVEEMSGPVTQGQLDRAAGIIAERLRAGQKVFVSTDTHIMLNEMDKNNKSPWTPLFTLRNMKEMLAKETKPGDLFFWLGFNGVSIWYYPGNTGGTKLWIDYDTPLRASKVDLVTCFARDPLHPDNNGDYALAHIEQNWDFGDSEVPVPFPPGRIAPISGLYQCLLYRMLDDVTAVKLK